MNTQTGTAEKEFEKVHLQVEQSGERMDKKNARGIKKENLEKSSHCGVPKISPNRFK